MSLEQSLGRVADALEKLIEQNDRILALRETGERTTTVTADPAPAAVETPAPKETKPKGNKKDKPKEEPAPEPAPEPEAPAEEEEEEPNLGGEEEAPKVTHADIRDFFRTASAEAKEAGDEAKITLIKKSFSNLLKAAKALDGDEKPSLPLLAEDQCAKFLADFKAAIA